MATPNTAWTIVDWSENIVLIENLVINIAKYLEKKGVQ